MAYKTNYLHIGSADDLAGQDRVLYRALEIMPAFLAWGTIALMIFLSWKAPVWIAIFIITFDRYI